MRPRFSLRGHKAPVTCVRPLHGGLVSSDRDGWIIIWSMAKRRPIALWKAHDGHILTLIVTKIGLISHGRDSAVNIWDVSEKSISVCSSETSAIGKDLPKPDFVEIPVNSLNFCNIDYQDGFLATPATVDSNNFDIYKIAQPFQLSRVLENVSVSNVSRAPSDIEEVNDPLEVAKRDGHGIIMKLVFLSKSILFVGYESGAVYGFHLKSDTSDRISGGGRSIIAKDLKISVVFASLEHKPSPVLSIAYDQVSKRLYTGSASKQLMEYDISELISKYQDSESSILQSAQKPNEPDNFATYGSPGSSLQKHNLRHYGIQCIELRNNSIITGFWDGVIKVFDQSFHELTRLERQEEAIRPEEAEIGKSSKKSLCMCTWEPSLEKADGRKQLLRRKKTGEAALLVVGYGDGLLTAFEAEYQNS